MTRQDLVATNRPVKSRAIREARRSVAIVAVGPRQYLVTYYDPTFGVWRESSRTYGYHAARRHYADCVVFEALRLICGDVPEALWLSIEDTTGDIPSRVRALLQGTSTGAQ